MASNYAYSKKRVYWRCTKSRERWGWAGRLPLMGLAMMQPREPGPARAPRGGGGGWQRGAAATSQTGSHAQPGQVGAVDHGSGT